jgi:hypothetical protein
MATVILTQSKKREHCQDDNNQADEVDQTVHFLLPAFELTEQNSELLFAYAFASCYDPPNASSNVIDRGFRAIGRQPLLACFRRNRLDDVAGEGRRLLHLLTGDFCGLRLNGPADFAKVFFFNIGLWQGGRNAGPNGKTNGS